MQVQSTYKYAKISPFKAREVTRAIQGMPASDALDLLRFTPKKAAPLVSKTLKSAIANAEHNNNSRAEMLVVKEAVVGEGPTMKRFVPKARGSAGPIRKRSSHIKITVTDEILIERREPKSKKKAGKKPTLPKATPAEAPAAPAEAPAAPAATKAEPEAPAVVETPVTEEPKAAATDSTQEETKA